MSDDTLALAQAQADTSSQERAFVDAVLADEQMRVAEGERAAALDPGQGYRLLRKPAVRSYMSRALQDRRERHAEIRDSVIHALWGLATYDIADAIDEDDSALDRIPETLDDAIAFMAGGRLKPPHKLPPHLRAAVKSVKFGKHGWEYTFVDRAQILLALAKHFGDQDKLDLGAGPDGSIVVETRRVVYYDAPDAPDK